MSFAVVVVMLVWFEIDQALHQDNAIGLAKLPFSQDGDVDSSKQFFVDGLSESLITALSRLNQLSISNPPGEYGKGLEMRPNLVSPVTRFSSIGVKR